MWLFSKKRDTAVQESALQKFGQRLDKAFSKLSDERADTLRWMDYFHKNQQQTNTMVLQHNAALPFLVQRVQLLVQQTDSLLKGLTQLQQQEQAMAKRLWALEDYTFRRQVGPDHLEIRNLIDEYYKHHELFTKIDALHQKISHLHESHALVPPKLEEMHERLSALEEKKTPSRNNFKEKLMNKLAKNSKDYVKNLIISYMKKYTEISAYKLKEMIVDEQGLCSKSSFYRILEEIEGDQEEISVVWEGKEKRYMVNLTKNT